MSNLSLLLGLEPLKKFVVGGGWWVGGRWLRVMLVLSLRLKFNKNIQEELAMAIKVPSNGYGNNMPLNGCVQKILNEKNKNNPNFFLLFLKFSFSTPELLYSFFTNGCIWCLRPI